MTEHHVAEHRSAHRADRTHAALLVVAVLIIAVVVLVAAGVRVVV